MQKNRVAALGVALIAAMVGTAGAQCPPDLWRMSFADEFTDPNLDLSTWSYETGRWPYNAELEYYHLPAMSVAAGHLSITARVDNRYNPPYTSGRINTRTKFLQQYGRFEMRARLPKGQGIWPAFWLLPQDTWPPEIDIMEQLGHIPTQIHFTNHWGVYPSVASQSQSFTGPDTSAGFHTYACEWYPGRIDFFFDGVRRASNVNAGVPDVPMYIILNLAVGGQWPGNPNATTVFPQQMVVDYVRAYDEIKPVQRLANPSFESRGSGNNIPLFGWVRSGNAFAENQHARTGAVSAKLYGNFTGGVNTSSIYQEMSVTPGETMAAVGWFYNWSADRMAGANAVTMNIEWRTIGNAVISRESTVAANASSPTDYLMRSVVFGTVPPNAAKARLSIEFRQTANTAGAIFIDDVQFGRVECPQCIGDFNEDGGIDGADIEAFFRSWEAGEAGADVSQDGGVDGSDVQVFFTAWERGSC